MAAQLKNSDPVPLWKAFPRKALVLSSLSKGRTKRHFSGSEVIAKIRQKLDQVPPRSNGFVKARTLWFIEKFTSAAIKNGVEPDTFKNGDVPVGVLPTIHSGIGFCAA